MILTALRYNWSAFLDIYYLYAILHQIEELGMVLLPATDDRTNLSGFRIEHNGYVRVVDGSIYEATTFCDTHELFMDINAFWATLPFETQSRIYNLYIEMFDMIESITSGVELLNNLTERVAELYSCWDFKMLCRFIDDRCLTVIPDDIRDDISEYDPDRTYVRADYRDLIHLAIALRPITVIWSMCARAIHGEVGTQFKEYDVTRLLNRTTIPRCRGYTKLTAYVHANCKASNYTLGFIHSGIGSAETPVWLRASALVRKIAIGHISHYTDASRRNTVSIGTSSNIVANVYKHIDAKIRSTTRSAGQNIHDKKSPGEYRDEDKESIAEGIQVNSKIPDSIMLAVGKYARNVEQMRADLYPQIPKQYVDRCLQSLWNRDEFYPTREQMALCQFAIDEIIGAKFVPLLQTEERLNAFAVAQAFYWEWGYHDLALLLTAKPLPVTGSPVRMNHSLNRISDEKVRILMKYYEHDFGPARGQGDDIAHARKYNFAIVGIEQIYAAMANRPYQLIAPKMLINLTSMPHFSDGGYCVPADFKIKLTDFVIQLQTYLSTKPLPKGY